MMKDVQILSHEDIETIIFTKKKVVHLLSDSGKNIYTEVIHVTEFEQAWCMI